MDKITKLHELRIETSQIKLDIWNQEFPGTKWWVIVGIILVFYIIWIKFSDKRRLLELLLFGSFIAVVRIIFDDWGISSGRWTYLIDLLPLGYSLFLNDLTVVPLTYMLLYQYSKTWKWFLLLSLIAQSAISFILLPILSKLGILIIHNWSYFRSFIFMIIAANFLRLILVLILRTVGGNPPHFNGR